MHPAFKLTLFGLVLVAATALVTTGILNAATPQEGPDEQELMKKYMEASKPGEPHQGLAKYCGQWDVLNQFQNGDKVQETAGSAQFEMILGGRFLVQKNQGNWSGMKYDGFQILGYDNVTRKYQSVWLDSMSSGMLITEGIADAKGCIGMQGPMKDVYTPKGRTFYNTFEPEGDDKFIVELWHDMKGKKEKCARFVYTRKQQ